MESDTTPTSDFNVYKFGWYVSIITITWLELIFIGFLFASYFKQKSAYVHGKNQPV